MENLARATGATLANSVDTITKSDLGIPGLVEEKKLSGDEMITVSKSKNPKAVSIIVRGGSDHIMRWDRACPPRCADGRGVVVKDKK